MKKEYWIALLGGLSLGQRSLLHLWTSFGKIRASNLNDEGEESDGLPSITIESLATSNLYHFLSFGHVFNDQQIRFQNLIPFLDGLFIFYSLSRDFDVQEEYFFFDSTRKQEGIVPFLAKLPKRSPLPVAFHAVVQREPPNLSYNETFFQIFSSFFPDPLLSHTATVKYDRLIPFPHPDSDAEIDEWYTPHHASLMWMIRLLESSSPV